MLLLVSFGLAIVGQSGVAAVFGDQTQVLRPNVESSVISLFGSRMTRIQFAGIGIETLIIVLVWFAMHKTRIGLVFRATACDEELATIKGVAVGRIRIVIFGVSSGLVGIAALVAGYDTHVFPMMGFNAMLPSVTAAVAGGIGSVRGAVFGGLLVALAAQFGGSFLPTLWQEAIIFVVLVVFLLIRPQGFFGKPLRRAIV
jgi:branched-chain amino acid transport system permease protein